MRTNEDLTKQHEELKKKLEDAKLAGSLESRQKGAQFAIVDPANYPMEPSPPGAGHDPADRLCAQPGGGDRGRLWSTP